MSTATYPASPAATILERMADAFRSGSPQQLADCFAVDGVLVHPMFGHVDGRAGILAAESGLFEAFIDIGFEVRRLIVGDDWSAAHYVISARQCRDIPLPTGDIVVNRGTRIELVGVELFRLNPDGLIAESHRYQDPGVMFGALMSGADLNVAPLHPAALVTPDGVVPDARGSVEAVKQAYETADLAGIADRYAPDGVLVHPMAGVLVGREAIVGAEGMLVSCFSDVEFRIERVIQNGWWAAAELTVTATHTAALPTPDGGVIEPTGRRIVDPVVQIFRLAPDGRMAYAERIFDTAALIRSLLT